MPTTNPRITITLKPGLHAKLRRLSALTGNSQSALVAELLDGSEPVFDRLITLLEAANLAKDEMREKLVHDLSRAQTRMEKQLGLALDDADTLTADLVSDLERVARRSRRVVPTRSGGAARKGPTPMSNRGVRSGPKTPKKPTGTRS